ncbi:MAG: hypothetical protein WCJ30_25355 [Deltaproteobacteria bacterium]
MTEPLPNPVYDEIAKRLWPEDHTALFFIHRLEVRAVHLERTFSTHLTKAELKAVRAALAAVEAT